MSGPADSDTAGAPPQSPPLKLRSYQTEMYERSLNSNSIVVMETGSGKTLVAIQRIKHALESGPKDKLIWFLAPAVALCRQQHDAVKSAIPYAAFRLIVGEDGPDRWSSRDIWDKVLHGVNVVFSTHAVLYQALGHAFVTIGRIALLIYDEAHHSKKSHPSNLIMQRFYFDRVRPPSCLPKILGLTASPSHTGKLEAVSVLEHNLDARCIYPRECRQELRKYVHRPRFERLPFLPSDSPLPSLVNAISLNPAVDAVGRKLAHVEEELGAVASAAFVKLLSQRLKHAINRDQSSIFIDTLENKRAVLTWLESLAAPAFTQVPGQLQSAMSQKADVLIRHLRQALNPSFVGLIFVRQRVATAMLARLLRDVPELAHLNAGSFVGLSSSTAYEKNISELIVVESDRDALQEFRDGTCRLLIATDAAEEGLDIPICNHVVCFDAPQNLKSFIQRRGRARKESSRFVILEDMDQDNRRSLDDWQQLENMIEMQFREDRARAEKAAALEDTDEEEEVDYVLRSPKIESRLDADGARSKLAHFCAKLPRRMYTDNNPEISLDEVSGEGISATVRLPMSVPSAVRTAQSARVWKTEKAAIRDASFHAMKQLYEFKLLNESFLPILQEQAFDNDFGKKRLAFETRRAKVDLWNLGAQDQRGHRYRTVMTHHNEIDSSQTMSLALWSPVDLTAVDDFDLYDHDTAHRISFQRPAVAGTLSDPEMSLLTACTNLLLGAARSQPMSLNSHAILVTPDIPIGDLTEWLAYNCRSMSLGEYRGKFPDQTPGILVNTVRGNSLHTFEGIELDKDESGDLYQQVQCKQFPKKKNFMKGRSNPSERQGTLQAAESRLFDIEEFETRLLPARFAWTTRLFPSVCFQIETVLSAMYLKERHLRQFEVRNMTLIEAITSPKTGLVRNYERLEFIGDCLLKYAATIQVYCEHVHWHEDYLHRERDTIISNSSLAVAAVEKGIDEYIITEALVAKNWRPPQVKEGRIRQEDRHLREKTVADVCEALFGAVYVDAGLECAREAIAGLLPKISSPPPPLGNTLQAGLASQKDCEPCDAFTECAESVLGYAFNHKFLIKEALCHPSCQRSATIEPYERMEFLGDAILDWIVVSELIRLLPEASQAHLTKLKAALVNADFLAFVSFQHSVTAEGQTYRMSSKHDGAFHTANQRRSLWELMLYGPNNNIVSHRRQAFERFQQRERAVIDSLYEARQYPWQMFSDIRAPKFLSDIIESSIGSIFVDSDGDLDQCRQFLGRIGLTAHIAAIVEKSVDVTHPKEHLSRLMDRKELRYKTLQVGELWACGVFLGDELIGETGLSHVTGLQAEIHAACAAIEAQGL